MFSFIKKYWKILSFLIIFLFIAFINYESYYNYYSEQKALKEQILITKGKVNSFSLAKLKKVEYSKLYYTPYKAFLWELSNKIWNAKKRVFIEMYMFTENDRFRKALLKAKEAGVDIKIILEKNPYKAPWINNKTYNFFKKHNIDVVWSNSNNYALNHTKLFLIDNEVIISTWNLTYSTFVFNRDFFLFIRDDWFVKKITQIFLNDYKGKKYVIYDDNLVLSPFYAKEKFEKLFNSSKKSLKMYFQYLDFRELEDLLIKKAWEGIKINIIVSKKYFNDHKEKINFLKRKKINIKYLDKIKMHAKAILVDDKVLFIWSQNFSKYSLEKNRELWIILNNKDVIWNFLKIFNKDFTWK